MITILRLMSVRGIELGAAWKPASGKAFIIHKPSWLTKWLTLNRKEKPPQFILFFFWSDLVRSPFVLHLKYKSASCFSLFQCKSLYSADCLLAVNSHTTASLFVIMLAFTIIYTSFKACCHSGWDQSDYIYMLKNLISTVHHILQIF